MVSGKRRKKNDNSKRKKKELLKSIFKIKRTLGRKRRVYTFMLLLFVLMVGMRKSVFKEKLLIILTVFRIHYCKSYNKSGNDQLIDDMSFCR